MTSHDQHDDGPVVRAGHPPGLRHRSRRGRAAPSQRAVAHRRGGGDRGRDRGPLGPRLEGGEGHLRGDRGHPWWAARRLLGDLPARHGGRADRPHRGGARRPATALRADPHRRRADRARSRRPAPGGRQLGGGAHGGRPRRSLHPDVPRHPPGRLDGGHPGRVLVPDADRAPPRRRPARRRLPRGHPAHAGLVVRRDRRPRPWLGRGRRRPLRRRLAGGHALGGRGRQRADRARRPRPRSRADPGAGVGRGPLHGGRGAAERRRR